MPTTLDEMTRAALTLSDRDRAELAERLWDSLPDDRAAPPSAVEADHDPEFLAELQRRIDGVRDGTTRTIPAEEVRRRMEADAAGDPHDAG